MEEESKKPRGGGKGKTKAGKQPSDAHVDVEHQHQGGDNSGASVDLLSQAAMTNAYFICHNVQDLMFFRGFYWAGAEKKGKGKKKKRQKL